ncbi:flagellar biosynthesis anti-sigma factor FlgM [Desulfurobacterium atlanticum]|uniref:Negative regulator of flagellin synthesis n=1 Tax=Desulfurobacterium atlanticum TaxID=240169 RepID=A0A238YGB0_9BACT|nr:flagellar biosynthesis anti-sigma factor FlgM [Desulfurobacterium atlanticum]SNR70286.1 anti-sigma-28 factor, FlgM family [Desulfurobacterium atlanticum]
MKIERFQQNFVDISDVKQKQLRNRERNGKLKGNTVQESVSLSSEGVNVELQIKEQVALKKVDSEKVDQIKQAIASGDYSVDVHKISDSIIKEILGL